MSNLQIKKVLSEFSLKQSQKNLSLADQQNQDLSNESRRLYDVFYDKLLLYSAGAFSFSITLIGLILSSNHKAMTKIGLWFPNIYWLYTSLGLYLLTCCLVLIARRSDAAYTGAFGMHNWTKKKKEEQEHRKDFLESHSGEVLVSGGSNEKEEIRLCTETIDKLESAIKKNKQAEFFYYSLKVWCHRISELTVVIATILFFFFTIQMMQVIAWG